MRVFVAGATGAIGRPLVAALVAAGHEVAGMTRSPAKAAGLEAAGASAVVCDAFDAQALTDAVVAFKPDVVINQLTDLPSKQALIPLKVLALNRVRSVGTDNLIAAAAAAGGAKVIAQSIAFTVPAIARKGVDHLEDAVLAAGGVVIRYGQFYGPGAWSAQPAKKGPVLHVETAARRTAELLGSPSGVVTVVDPA